MNELDLFRDFNRGVAAPSAEAQRRASARLASALDGVVGGEKAARLHQRRRRWPLAAVAAVILVAALLVTPAFGIGDRLLSLIQQPTRLDVSAPAWSPDGRTIVFVSGRDGNGEVYAMNADGSEPRNLTQHPANDVRPAWSPEGRRIAFVSRRDGNSEIYVMNADGSGKRNLTRSRATTTIRCGHRRAGRLRPGAPRRAIRPRPFRYQLYVVNADGSGLRRLTLRVPEGTPERQDHFAVVSWSGHRTGGRSTSGATSSGPTGAERGGSRIYRLTAGWSPDGRRIAFVGKMWTCTPWRTWSVMLPSTEIHVMNADGSGSRKLTHNACLRRPTCLVSGRAKIAFRSTRNGNRDIYVMNADGSGKRNLTRNPARDGSPSWSPDGRRIAFVSNRDGRLEAHVMNADGSGQRSRRRGHEGGSKGR